MTNFDRLQTMTRDRVRRLERRRDRLEAAGAFNPVTPARLDALIDLMDVEDELDQLREQARVAPREQT